LRAERGGDCVWEALEPVDHGEDDVVDATVLQLIHDAQPELGALALLDPQAEDVLLALAIERQGTSSSTESVARLIRSRETSTT